MAYTEERVFSLRLELRCEFPDDYEGEADGYVWASGVPDLIGDIVQAAMRAVAARPGWRLRGSNRGRSTEDEVVLVLDRVLPAES